jgi:glycerol-3-phosphate acyltransferase PlsY
MKFAVMIVSAYLLGSVPFALIIAKAHGKNLRIVGSGNIGATNLARAAGRKWGYLCFLLDVSKGFLPMLVTSRLIETQPSILELFLWLAVGCAAISGHVFPIYIGFKGGKGVATSFGVALGLWPYFTLCAVIAIAVWLTTVLIWRYVSLGSITAAIIFPAVLVILISVLQSWRFVNLWPLLIVAAAIPLMIIIRHRENIRRILAGTERKIFNK